MTRGLELLTEATRAEDDSITSEAAVASGPLNQADDQGQASELQFIGITYYMTGRHETVPHSAKDLIPSRHHALSASRGPLSRAPRYADLVRDGVACLAAR